MTHRAVFFGYQPGDSLLHRLDARAKLPPVLLLMVLAMVGSSLVFPPAAMALVLGVLMAADVEARRLWRAMRPLVWLAAVTMLYHLLFGRQEGEVLWRVDRWTLTTAQIHDGAFYAGRLLVFVAAALLLTLTTSPSGLAEAVTRLLSPLRRIGVPVNDIGLVLFIALRFVPILAVEFAEIRQAQAVRGVRIEGPWRQRVRRTVAILVPVFVTALRRADELAAAIRARGYDSHRPRTWYPGRTFGRREWVFMTVACGVVVSLYLAVG